MTVTVFCYVQKPSKYNIRGALYISIRTETCHRNCNVKSLYGYCSWLLVKCIIGLYKNGVTSVVIVTVLSLCSRAPLKSLSLKMNSTLTFISDLIRPCYKIRPVDVTA
jgi:hypothetical protein